MRIVFVIALTFSVGFPSVCQRIEVFLNQGEIRVNPILIENKRILIDHGPRIAFWDIDRSMLLRAFDMNNQFISGVPVSQRPFMLSSSGKFFVTSTVDSIYIYDVTTQELSYRFKNSINPYADGIFSFTRDENYLVYSLNDHINFLNTSRWDTLSLSSIPIEFNYNIGITGNHLLIKKEDVFINYELQNNNLQPHRVRVDIDSAKLDFSTSIQFIPFDNDRVIVLYKGTTTQVALLNLESGKTEKVFSFPFEIGRRQWDPVTKWLAFTPDPYKKDDNRVTLINFNSGSSFIWKMSAKMKEGLQKGAYGDVRMEGENLIINCHDEAKVRGFHFASRNEWSVDGDIQLNWMNLIDGKILYRTAEDRDKSQYRVFDPATSKTSFINTGSTYLPLHPLSQTNQVTLIEKKASNRYTLGSFHDKKGFNPLKWMETNTLPVSSQVVSKVGESYVIKLSPPKTVIDERNEFGDFTRIFNPLSQQPDRYITHDITTGESANLKSMNVDERISSEGYFYTHFAKNEYGFERADSIALVSTSPNRMEANVNGKQLDVLFKNNSGSLHLAKEIHFSTDRKTVIFLINSELHVIKIQDGLFTELNTIDLQKALGRSLAYYIKAMFIDKDSKILLHEGGMRDNTLFMIDVKSLTLAGKFLSKSEIVMSALSYPFILLKAKGHTELWNVESNKMFGEYAWANQKWMMNSVNTMFNHEGKYFAIHEAAGVLTVYHTATGEKIKEWSGLGQVKIVSFRGLQLYCLDATGVPLALDISTGTRTRFSSPFAIHQVVDGEYLNNTDSLLFTTGTSDINIWNLNSKKLYRKIFLLDSTNLFVMNDSLFYTMGKENLSSVLIRKGKVVSEASQIDIVYNKPSVFSVGKNEYARIKKRLLEDAYKKRLRVSGIKDPKAASDLVVDIANKSSLTSFPTNEKIDLKLSFRGKHSRLSTIVILVNDVPVMKSSALTGKPIFSMDTTISVLLADGYNRVKIYGVDGEGMPSNHFPLHFYLKSPGKPIPKTYFLGIGIDRFAEANHDLTWSVKDIKDLAKRLKEKIGASLVIDTLFNEHVSVDNALKMRQRLLTSNVNDKVIVAYSGHGLLNNDMDYFLSTYNVQFAKPDVNGLPYTTFETLLDNIPARKRLMLIDACHSGELDPESIPSIQQVQAKLDPSKKGYTIIVDGNRKLGIKSSFELMKEIFTDVGKQCGATIISAAAGTQFAYEYGNLKNGVFTYCILEAMNNNTTLTVNKLKRIVSKRVDEITSGNQQPTYRNETLDFDWEMW